MAAISGGTVMPQIIKDILAVSLSIAAAVLAIKMMLHGEAQVVSLSPEAMASSVKMAQLHRETLQGLMQYFQGIGAAIFFAGAAYIMVDQEERLSTSFQDK